MDKKKVIKHINDAISSIDWYDYANEKEDLDIAFKHLNQALKELKKPEWISVMEVGLFVKEYYHITKVISLTIK